MWWFVCVSKTKKLQTIRIQSQTNLSGVCPNSVHFFHFQGAIFLRKKETDSPLCTWALLYHCLFSYLIFIYVIVFVSVSVSVCVHVINVTTDCTAINFIQLCSKVTQYNLQCIVCVLDYVQIYQNRYIVNVIAAAAATETTNYWHRKFWYGMQSPVVGKHIKKITNMIGKWIE